MLVAPALKGITFLPQDCEKDLFGFGDPMKLKDGICLKEKGSEDKKKTVFSLYELDLGIKYQTDQGYEIKRVSEKQIVVKKKANPLLGIPTNVKQSKPINIGTSVGRNSGVGNEATSPFFLMSPPIKTSYFPKRINSMDSVTSDPSQTSSSVDSRGSPGTPMGSFSEKAFELVAATRSQDDFSPDENSFKIVVEIQTPYIPGEKIEKVVPTVEMVEAPFVNNKRGTLYMTNYQLIFVPAEKEGHAQSEGFFPEPVEKPNNVTLIPYATIARFEKVDKTSGQFMFGQNSYSFDIFTKEVRKCIRFVLDPTLHVRREICQILTRFIFPTNQGDVFALCSGKQPGNPKTDGWLVFNFREEFERFKIKDQSDSGWRLSTVNENFALCPTYPKLLVVPQSVDDEDLRNDAQFRSKGRIPVLAWRNPVTGACLTRCSQPRTGMTRTFRCKADEKILKCIQLANPNSKKLYILDARPMANAIANMALGGGYENISFYPDCELEFMGISNIHTVRDSYNKLKDLCESHTFMGAGENKTPTNTWLSSLETTHWLEYIAIILLAALRIVQLIDVKKESVLLHCSDGWDRTPQVSSLAQILLDEHYRTVKGFCQLVEKEWLHYGHKFGDRLGLNLDESNNKDVERAPIFLQFIDCTWQIMQQFPYSFEFSEDFLVSLMGHMYSGRFGTFLMNSQKEREEEKLHEKSPSIWTYFLENPSKFHNPFYAPGRDPLVLRPSCDMKTLQFWKSYYFRHLVDPSELHNKILPLGMEMREEIRKLKEENEKLRLQLEKLSSLNGHSHPEGSLADWVNLNERKEKGAH